MVMARRLLLTLLGVLVLHSAAIAQQTVHWETSIDSAKRIAAQSNRLVLVVFSAPWCMACRAMEAEVLAEPAVMAALDAHYVPTRLNADYYRGTAGQYGVSALPTTVILAPGGRQEVLDVIQGKIDARQFAARLNQVAANARQRTPAVYTQITSSTATGGNAAPGMADMPASGPIPAASVPAVAAAPLQPPVVAREPGAATGAAVGAGGPPSAAPPTTPATAPVNPPLAGPPPVPAVPGLASSPPPLTMASLPQPAAPTAPPLPNPPLGLEGYCPVQLVEKAKWIQGSERWGAVHRGQTYLFAGQEEQQHFLAAPDHYAPVNSGNDVVLALEQGRSVPGACDHGVTFSGRVYLFADQASLERFSKNPRYYADRATEAMHRGTLPAPQMR
jgi:YHS domain-containing protein/thioredoxin-related protein